MQGGQRRSITWWTRRVGDERGAAVLETLLISVVLLLLFAGAVDVGRMYFSYIIITNAAREGARMAARLPCNLYNRAEVRQLIINAAEQETDVLPTYPREGAVQISIEPDPVAAACFVAGEEVAVTVEYDYQNVFTTFLGTAGFPMSNSVTMVAFGNDQQ